MTLRFRHNNVYLTTDLRLIIRVSIIRVFVENPYGMPHNCLENMLHYGACATIC